MAFESALIPPSRSVHVLLGSGSVNHPALTAIYTNPLSVGHREVRLVAFPVYTPVYQCEPDTFSNTG